MKPEKGDLQIVGENKSKNQAVCYLETEAKKPEWLSPTPDVCAMAHYLSSIVWLTSTVPSAPQHFCAIAAFQEVKLELCQSLKKMSMELQIFSSQITLYFEAVLKCF